MIGIIPAAGSASRMFGIPKMLLPTPGGVLLDVLAARMAGVTTHLYTGTRSGLFGMLSGRLSSDAHTVYLANTATMAMTVKLAERFAPDQPVVFGMPDTWIEDDRAFVKLASALEDGADVAAGLFHVRPGQRNGGLCAVEADRVVDVVDKPEVCAYPYIWGALAWRPAFWPLIDPATPHIGYALPRAIAKGLNVHAVMLDGNYWDCGTPDDYFDCIDAQRAAQTVAAW